jgi:hypothetical protein
MISAVPQLLFVGGGVGTTCAFKIQATIDPPAAGTEKVGGEIV